MCLFMGAAEGGVEKEDEGGRLKTEESGEAEKKGREQEGGSDANALGRHKKHVRQFNAALTLTFS